MQFDKQLIVNIPIENFYDKDGDILTYAAFFANGNNLN